MEIFNIHLFEFLLIAALALVVFGPERLPEVGRFAGKQVARFLAWQQQSPELKLINDVRSEFEQEIASLRDELVRTRNQLDLSQDSALTGLRDELRPMLNLREPPKLASGNGASAAGPGAPAVAAEASPALNGASTAGSGGPAVATDTLASAGPPLEPPAPDPVGEGFPPAEVPPAEGAPPPAPEAPAALAPEGTIPATGRPNRLAATEPTSALTPRDDRLDYLEQRRSRRHDPPDDADTPTAAQPAAPAALGGSGAGLATDAPDPALAAAEIRLLIRQIESLSADLQTLISGLQAQGVIGADWQPEAALSEQEHLSR